MEKLIVKNFGVLKDVEIDIKDVMVFIGKNGSGKSTIAKIFSILTDYISLEKEIKNEFKKFNINFFKYKTVLKLKYNDKNYINCENIENLNIIKEFGFSIFLKPIYIPSERSFISLTSNSLMSLINADIPIPKFITEFGANYEKARREINNLEIDFLGVIYKFENGEDRIYHSKDEFIKLSESASGFQTLIPMFITIKYLSQIEQSKLFVIEEPELNLYPTVQKAFVEFLVKECLKNDSKLIITTHSPYILTAFNNLLFANKVASLNEKAKEKVSRIIDSESFVDSNNFGAWYVEDGKTRDIFNSKTGLIADNEIDDVSEEVAGEFDKLMEIFREYKNDKSI